MDNSFYVYGYVDPEYNNYMYIGKGTRNRMYVHWKLTLKNKSTHNKRFARRLLELHKNNLRPEIVVIKNKLSAAEAYILEADLIKKFGRYGYDKNGCLLNHSVGFEHFNIKNLDELKTIMETSNSKPHFNIKFYSEELINYACDLYISGLSQKQVTDKMAEIGNRVSYGKLREWLVNNDIYIRTKSDTRQGVLNPAFGRKGLITKGFYGKNHTLESKMKTSKTLREKHKISNNLILQIVELRKKNVSYHRIKAILNLSISYGKIRREYLRYIEK